MSETLFSYGTLRKTSVQLDLFGRPLTGAEDALENYRLVPIETTDEAFLARGEQKRQMTLVASDGGDVVEGMAFELSAEELLVADSYEPDTYARVKVTLRSGKEAWIYTATERA